MLESTSVNLAILSALLVTGGFGFSVFQLHRLYAFERRARH